MRFSPTLSAVALMLAVAVFISPLSAAYAAEKDEVDPRVNEAMTACLSNNVEKGIGILAQLYTETQDAIWIFNQARCYQQNDKLEDARKRFVEFRRKNRRKDQARDARALENMTEIDNELERREKNAARAQAAAKTVEPAKAQALAPAPTPAPTQAVPAYVPPAAPAATHAVADIGAAQAKADDGSKPIYGQWWFWAGVGGILVASVAVIAVSASGTKTVLECGQPMCYPGPGL